MTTTLSETVTAATDLVRLRRPIDGVVRGAGEQLPVIG